MRFLIAGNILILLFLLGCEKGNIDNIKTVDYVYKNNSGIDLILEVYNSENVLLNSYDIPSGNEIKTNTTASEVPALFSFDTFEDKIGQSIIVRFNGDKCLYYNNNNSDRIFKIQEYDNYSEELLKQSNYTLIYTFTNIEYSNSINCN
jgi:hypothetical protein